MSEATPGRRYGRRAFLGVAAAGISAIAWGEPAWRGVENALGRVNGGLPNALGSLAPGSGWRIYTVASTMPTFDPATWRLEIGGLVDHPVSLGYDDLRALPRAEQISTFHCVTGWTVANVHWAGVRFRDLLQAAGPSPEAHALQFVSAEVPYVDTLTTGQAFLPDVMLAYEMDGKPLSRPHGAPARVVIPDMYGYKGVKWVRRIDLVRAPEDGFWEQRGYDRDAWVGHSNGYG